MKKTTMILIASLLFLIGCTTKDELPTNNNTSLSIVNNSDDSVLVCLTLGVIDTNYISNVEGIFGITTTGSQGSFYLQAHDTISYQSPANKGFNGNVSFGMIPSNCPIDSFRYGNNIFEFTLNNGFGITASQETTEISCVAGVNSLMSVNLNGGGYWTCTTGIDSVTYFYNDSLYKNKGLIGVFPFGCDDCTSIANPPCDSIKPYATPQERPICVISRPSGLNGGNIYLTFKSLVK